MPTGVLCAIVLRAVLFSLGVAGLGWAANSFSYHWKTSDVADLAKQVIFGYSFDEAALTKVVSELAQPGAIASSSFVRASAVLRLKILELAIAGANPTAIDARSSALNTSIKASVLLAPADPFLWYVLFWFENNTSGYRADSLKYIELSYSLGARELWIAERRNRAAVTVFSDLTPATQDSVVSEFAGLLDNDLTTETAGVLVGAGWNIRDRLLGGLAGLDPGKKLRLSRMLREEGFRVDIPGIVESDKRPWR